MDEKGLQFAGPIPNGELLRLHPRQSEPNALHRRYQHLQRRLHEHKAKLTDGFTAKYQIDRLVHYEETSDVTAAIEREKQKKGWRREKKTRLIEKANPLWEDLSDHVYEERQIGK